MANYTKRKAIHFTPEQAQELERLSKLPEYIYNNKPSEAAVVRDALALFLAQKSTTADDSNRPAA